MSKQVNTGRILSALDRELRRAERAAAQLRRGTTSQTTGRKTGRLVVISPQDEKIAAAWEQYADKLRGNITTNSTRFTQLTIGMVTA
jgi:hypothetical protein